MTLSHALVTIISHVPKERVDEARRLIEALGNPASPAVSQAFEAVAGRTGDLAIHFASLNVFPATSGGGHLVFEFSGDGDEPSLIRSLATQLGPHVGPAYDLAADRGSAPLADYWASHVVKIGQGFLDNAGVVFAGAPGHTVKRIRAEHQLRERLKVLVEEDPLPFTSGLSTLERVRDALRSDAAFAWALKAEHAVALEPERSGVGPYLQIVWRVTKMYLWPLAIPALLVFALSIATDYSLRGIVDALVDGFVAGIATILIALVATAIAYVAFRKQEDADQPDFRPPDPNTVATSVARENFAAQNHLSALSVMKPGLLRRAALKLVFTAIVQLVTFLYRPGWLGTLGTIHFARWVMVPGTGDLLFFSNYGGSWESYLEDFITKAHGGLTGVWSNTRRLSADDEPRAEGRQRRRQLQALGAPSAGADGLLVHGVSGIDDDEHPDERGDPSGPRHHPHRRRSRSLAAALRRASTPRIGDGGERDSEPGVRRPRLPEVRQLHRLHPR